MKLRKAELKDFEEFKILYTDIDFECLGTPLNLPDEPLELSDEVKRILKDIENIENFDNGTAAYSEENFKKDIESNKIFIFVAEEQGKIVGYFYICACPRTVWHIDGWSAVPNTRERRHEMFLQLEKIMPKRVRKLELSCLHDKEYWESEGFEYIRESGCFYEKEYP